MARRPVAFLSTGGPRRKQRAAGGHHGHYRDGWWTNGHCRDRRVSQFPYAGPLAVAWGASDYALDLNGFNQTVAGLATYQNRTAANQMIGNWANGTTSTLTIGGTTTNITGGNGSFGGTITNGFYMSSGTVALVLNGNGSPAAANLTGVNSYSGGTTVNWGL